MDEHEDPYNMFDEFRDSLVEMTHIEDGYDLDMFEIKSEHTAETDRQPEINWVEGPPKFRDISFTGKQEIKMKPKGNKPIDYFFMLADEGFINSLIKHTNARARLTLTNDPNLQSKSGMDHWEDVDLEEFLVFLGLTFQMGIVQIAALKYYWDTDPLFQVPIFIRNMSRARYSLILRSLCLTEITQNDQVEDVLYMMQPFVDYFNNKMSCAYSPGKNISLDAIPIDFGKFMCEEYIKNQIYFVAESSGPILKMQAYPVHDVDIKENWTNAALNIMSEYVNKGHSLYMSSSYNSIKLASKLLDMSTHCTGNLSRKELPVDMRKPKPKDGETMSRFGADLCIGKWNYRGFNISYISTEFGSSLVEIPTKRGTRMKPEILVQYGKHKAEKILEEMFEYWPLHRKHFKWYTKAILHIIEVLLYNSYVLYSKSDGPEISFLEFREMVIDSLLPKYENENAKPHLPSKIKIDGSRANKLKQCWVCYGKAMKKETMYYCGRCAGDPGLCKGSCFKAFHKKK